MKETYSTDLVFLSISQLNITYWYNVMFKSFLFQVKYVAVETALFLICNDYNYFTQFLFESITKVIFFNIRFCKRIQTFTLWYLVIENRKVKKKR